MLIHHHRTKRLEEIEKKRLAQVEAKAAQPKEPLKEAKVAKRKPASKAKNPKTKEVAHGSN